MKTLLRMAPLLAAAIAVLCAPEARADQCTSICASDSVECRRECAGDQECLKDCDESKRLCPDICKAMTKGGADKKAVEREVLKVIEREEQRQAEAAAKSDEAHAHDHVQKDVVK